ncbi:SRPBCC family protein [Umezawaea endophytica]|uniref:SRPBCC family protein n=1 Tax=Umezawaea endophytica TaxID=1654476 RepID=A0A9X3A562_9PSEU|nr:SRPBCC family protein [Umezawaea endophytica]MCS7483494.1 SRPBCC family protein [Umezawaea endophytica]
MRVRTCEQSIDVFVPVSVVYGQWALFEAYPRFMSGVVRVRRGDGTRVRWTTLFGGVRREFDVEVTDQRPDELIAWRSTSGADRAGAVALYRVDDRTTRVRVRTEVEPEGIWEQVCAASGVLDQRLRSDLERFKELVESTTDPFGAT